ncbi:hypothetical protein ABT282_08385 [Streptomyces sp. NPDC000927]|uniref:hypothetical protein n=1 Tax=Streptomyces sp. NPDC000927 TaxID=3154371 RepID=UPI003333C857
MSEWVQRFRGSRWVKEHPNGVFIHGSTEPILTILDVRGFEIKDLFLIGFNDNCGTIVLPTKRRAEEARAALEPAYLIELSENEKGDWRVKFDRRELDGSVKSHFITDLELKDGRQVIKGGRWMW